MCGAPKYSSGEDSASRGWCASAPVPPERDEHRAAKHEPEPTRLRDNLVTEVQKERAVGPREVPALARGEAGRHGRELPGAIDYAGTAEALRDLAVGRDEPRSVGAEERRCVLARPVC